MFVGQIETASTIKELEQKLRRLGLPDAPTACVAEGLSGDEDAGVFIPKNGPVKQVQGVGFSTTTIAIAEAHRLVRAMTSLRPLRKCLIWDNIHATYYSAL